MKRVLIGRVAWAASALRAVRSWGVMLALALSLCLPAGLSRADTLRLKDGRVLDGKVVKEVDGYVWFEFAVGDVRKTLMFSPSEITKLDRDEPADEPAGDRPEESARPGTPGPGAGADSPRSGAPRAVVISLGDPPVGDMVGVYMTAAKLRDMIPVLEQDKIDIVVFRINSGGGMLLEIQRLSDVIHNEYKPRFRTVAWIESAISAAAMTAHCLEEIYFMPQGNYGACTGWFGQLQAVEGRDLEEVLFRMEKISARGKHDPKIMRSMQITDPLSATIDANGDVTWYQDETSGDHIVNKTGYILTFNSETAAKFKFSQGTAATLDELAKAMKLEEVEWVGAPAKGVPYPVSRAESLMRDFRAQTKTDEDNTARYFENYQSAIQLAQGAQREERGKFIGRARSALTQIVRMVKNNPNFSLLIFNLPDYDAFQNWVREQEELLRDLAK